MTICRVVKDSVVYVLEFSSQDD